MGKRFTALTQKGHEKSLSEDDVAEAHRCLKLLMGEDVNAYRMKVVSSLKKKKDGFAIRVLHEIGSSMAKFRDPEEYLFRPVEADETATILCHAMNNYLERVMAIVHGRAQVDKELLKDLQELGTSVIFATEWTKRVKPHGQDQATPNGKDTCQPTSVVNLELSRWQNEYHTLQSSLQDAFCRLVTVLAKMDEEELLGVLAFLLVFEFRQHFRKFLPDFLRSPQHNIRL